MDTQTILSLVQQLQENVEDLQDNLEPLITGALATTTKKLPLLDRAKLNVLLVYSIESLLFSYLKLHGVSVKEHPVFRELTRVKQYFEKIKQAEAGPNKAQPTLTLDRDAAGRFIKHALAGNDKYDLERAEREAREKVLAKRKLKDLETSMKEKADLMAKEVDATSANDALQQAARLASVSHPGSLDESSASSTDTENGIDDSDLLEAKPGHPTSPIQVNQSSEPQKTPTQPQQGKKRKSKAKAKSLRAKRLRETGSGQRQKPPKPKKAAKAKQSAKAAA